jgi:membrane protease YdiL (CAAX protease family)
VHAIQPVWWDLIPIVLLCAGMPLLAALVTIPRIRAMSAADQDRLRPRLYVNAMISQWLFALAALLPWLLRDEPLAGIGLKLPARWWLYALGGTLIVALALVAQRRKLKAAPDGAELVAAQLKGAAFIIPKSRREVGLWALVSLHAGVCEELLYRGYLFALARAIAPDWVAAVAVTAAFGLAHLYQGAKGVVQTAVVGAILLLLAWASDSLWLPMATHALFDWHSGTLGRWAMYGNHERANPA